MVGNQEGASAIPIIERKSLCLPSPKPGLASHQGEHGFADKLARHFVPPENNAAEKLVELKAELKGADTETFWRRLMEGMTEICHSQYAFVAKRILVDDHDSAIEMPPIGEPGSCLLGVAFYYNDGQDVRGLHRDYKYLAWGAPCAHMRHDKVFLIPEKLSSFITNNPNAFPFPAEAYLGLPLFSEGKCFAHFGMMWTQDGLNRRDVSWGYLEMILHSLEELILERLLRGESFVKAPGRTKSKVAKVIPIDAITASQSLKPYARSLSHELRTPMQGVVGMLDVMHATVQEAIEGQPNSKVRNVFQALKENIEVVQDSSRRAVEAADNVVHAYDLDMQVPGTPQHEDQSPTMSLSATGVFENRPGILIEGSNIPVNPYKRRRSSPVAWNYGSSTKMRNVRASPRRKELSPCSEELKSVVLESEAMLRATSESPPDAPNMSPDAHAPQTTRRSSLRACVDGDPSQTPGLRQCRIRELIPLVIHESLRVGGRPDSAIAEPIALGEKIEVRTRASSGQTSQINIEWTVHPDVPDTLLMDERDLTKLISCVFLNAIKFTEVGNVTLTAQPSRNGRFVLVHIIDTGPGIPADFISELFKPFSREDASLTRTKEGLGLGLLVAKGIARRIGGDLTLVRSNTSGDNRGSEFEIKVPIDVSEASRPSSPSNRTPTPSGLSSFRSVRDPVSRPTSFHSKTSQSKSRGSPLQPTSPSQHNSNPIATPSMFDDPLSSSPRRTSSASAKVPRSASANMDTFDRKLAEKYPLTFLVAEDNKINRKLLVSMLGKLGYKTVYEAFDGKEAVRIMRDVCQSDQAPTPRSKSVQQERGGKGHLKPVDVILMDLWMPEMDGYEATEHILHMFDPGDEGKPNQPSFPVPTVLAVSADVTDEAIGRAMATGMEGFMTKPYKLTDLQRLIEEFCVRSERN